MVRELRRTHLRLWLVLGPLLALMTGAVLLTRGPGAIPTAEQSASMNQDLPPVGAEQARGDPP